MDERPKSQPGEVGPARIGRSDQVEDAIGEYFPRGSDDLFDGWWFAGRSFSAGGWHQAPQEFDTEHEPRRRKAESFAARPMVVWSFTAESIPTGSLRDTYRTGVTARAYIRGRE
jgi:hypothetical protein